MGVGNKDTKVFLCGNDAHYNMHMVILSCKTRISFCADF